MVRLDQLLLNWEALQSIPFVTSATVSPSGSGTAPGRPFSASTWRSDGPARQKKRSCHFRM